MKNLISACTYCLSLRADPLLEDAFVPWNFRWAGACVTCNRPQEFEAVGTVRYTTTPAAMEG
jgi:hypothetical protein